MSVDQFFRKKPAFHFGTIRVEVNASIEVVDPKQLGGPVYSKVV
jgi:hypothetical protein